MSLNTLTIKKFLLIAGLLIVVGQGLWQLPELQDYLFPVDHEALLVSRASKECASIKGDVKTLTARVNYLQWFQAHNGPEAKISADRWRAFPFSESIRSLAPRSVWDANIRLAHKNRLKVERELLYLEALINNMDENPRVHSSHASPANPAKPAALSISTKLVQQFQEQRLHYNAELMELTKQLART